MDPNFYYTFNGFILHALSEAPKDAIIIAHPRLVGGKGGFGNMLRAIGSQIQKTTNREMCRDLTGRRIRDVNNEKKFKEWLDKADEREKAKIEAYLEKRRKRKHLLEQGPSTKIPFEEKTDSEKRQQIAQELQDAIEEAFAKRSKGLIKKAEEPTKSKLLKLNVDSDLDSSSSSCPSPSREPSTVEPECSTTNETENTLASDSLKDNESSDDEVESFIEEPAAKKTKVEEEDEVKVVESPIKVVKKVVEYPPIDLNECGSVNSLLTFDLIWIKHELAARGLKCGGTLMERAQRLFACKGLERAAYPEHILAGAQTKKRKY